jgi:hypothetical protein
MIEQRPVAQGYQGSPLPANFASSAPKLTYITVVSPHCAQCELTQNLWLCLTCGQVSCGRKQFGGIGGNGHALDHYKQTGHGVGVKLGTITPEGGGGEFFLLLSLRSVRYRSLIIFAGQMCIVIHVTIPRSIPSYLLI